MYEAGGSRHLNFNNNMSTAAVFLDIEKAFDTYGTLVTYINYQN
jgi:hypothetical protein